MESPVVVVVVVCLKQEHEDNSVDGFTVCYPLYIKLVCKCLDFEPQIDSVLLQLFQEQWVTENTFSSLPFVLVSA